MMYVFYLITALFFRYSIIYDYILSKGSHHCRADTLIVDHNNNETLEQTKKRLGSTLIIHVYQPASSKLAFVCKVSLKAYNFRPLIIILITTTSLWLKVINTKQHEFAVHVLVVDSFV